MELDRFFDQYYFVDKNPSAVESLSIKLSRFQNIHSLKFISEDANKELQKLATLMQSSKYAALILLDPFGMQIDWTSIEQFKNTRTDVWILIPTGVIVNRLLDKNMELIHIDKLKTFFGMEESEIKKSFYNQVEQPLLFGNEYEIKYQKISNPIKKISEIYIKKLMSIWKYVTQQPLVLLNSHNVPIYHFAFASNNRTALKIAKDIIKS